MPALNRWLQRGVLDGELNSGLGWHEKLGSGPVQRVGFDPIAEVNEPTDQIPGNTSTPFSIAIGGEDTGVMNFLGDRDWFSVTLTAGEVYIFTLTGSGGTPLSDPYLVLYNSAGVQIALNDDADFPNDFNSVLTFTPSTSGTYYLGAQAYEGSGGLTGGYTLTAAISTPLDSINWMETMSTTSIDVYFATTGQMFNGETALRGWTPAEVNAAMAALNTFAQFTTLTFNQVFSPTGAEMVLSLADVGEGVLGYFQVGTPYGFFNPNEVGWDATGLQQGGYGFVTLIHELGHGLGLAHPHDTGGSSTIMPGVTGPFDFYGDHLLNQGVFTTMSYNDGWPGGPLPQPSTSGLGWQGTPMALDIGMLQQFYGVNPNFHNTGTTYALADVTGEMFLCIWDTGGVDTISFGGSAGCVIDLRAATLQYETGGGGWVSYVSGASGGYTIANGVVIENATGGSGIDALIGNDADNVLNGGGGSGEADFMTGGAGNDTYFVDSAGDSVTEHPGEGTDTVQSSVTYVMTDGVENVVLTGSAIGATGNSLDNVMTGNSADNQFSGGGGDDTMLGGAGNDRYVVVDAGDTVIENPGEGTDLVEATRSFVLPANTENLILSGPNGINGAGNALNNSITGNNFNNVIGGLAGVDTLVGGAGQDDIDGGTGIDTAVYSLASTSATWMRNVDGSWTITAGADGTDIVREVEFLEFTDRDVFLDRAQRTFSGNGTSDVLFRRSDGIMASWEVTGTSINSASFLPTAPASWNVLGTGDISGDGRDDVIWQRSDGLVYSWTMNGGSVSGAVGIASVGAQWSFLGVGDFNGDLTDDLAWQRTDGLVYIWSMNGSAIQSASAVTSLPAAWDIAGLGDFNGDGRDDFLWRNSSTGQSVIWHMNGSTIASSGPTSEQAGLDWAVVGVGDTNGDGRDDIILQRASDGMVAVWAMDGTGVTSATDVSAANPSLWTIQNIGDYNGDGRDDILWQHDNGLVYVWLMNGASIQSAGALAGIGGDWGII